MKTLFGIIALIALTFVATTATATNDTYDNDKIEIVDTYDSPDLLTVSDSYEFTTLETHIIQPSESPAITGLQSNLQIISKKLAESFGSYEKSLIFVSVVNQKSITDMSNTLKNIASLVAKLNGITGVSFVSVKYTNKDNEVQQTTFNVGVSYQKAKEKDIEFLKDLDVTKLESDLPNKLLEEARTSLLGALVAPNKKRSQAQKDAYHILNNGLKVHKETGQLYVYGMKVKKKVLKEGEYKEDTRRPLTKAKDTIRKQMKSTQYRQYKIDSADNFSLKGDTLIFE